MKPRVIQWATGAMGKTCLRAVIDRPDLELVGLFVYDERKAGRDAGDIARREPTGVIATRDRDAILALDADIVIHAPRLDPPFERHDPDILALLRSGKNVISLNGGTFPKYWAAERRAVFEAACAEGRSSFMGAGLNPGFAAEKLLVSATNVCIAVERASVQEHVDCRAVKSPQYVFDVIGFGAPVHTINPNDPSWTPARTMNALFAEVVAAVADRLGFTLDEIETRHALAPARERLTIAAGLIEPGGAARIDWRWVGRAGGRDRVDLGITWSMEPPAPDETEKLWRLRIDGSPCVDLAFGVSTPEGWTERTTAEQLGVAGAVVNSIPVVIAAPPGLAETPIAAPWRAFAPA